MIEKCEEIERKQVEKESDGAEQMSNDDTNKALSSTSSAIVVVGESHSDSFGLTDGTDTLSNSQLGSSANESSLMKAV